MHSLNRSAQAKLDDLKSRHLHRRPTGTFREDGIWVERLASIVREKVRA